ncbi:DUF512 domain-containing protein [Anaeromassilibacillus sp. An250]|uniref:DUF512 domain-containing protein n=1 Tax=Anaeromassilibacillus sp. An250 TaxID=1965604 RepID=UPI000B3A7963|nr:DUF512 domain-containing protein [Anaeromassilibacillus sp. An250]OUO76210.1 Fe/S oxidoreductase [Anaeromassilibacillus sp. An250]
MPVKILAVEPGGPASHAGVRPGETLLSINGNEICDILDYRFYETDRHLSIVLRDDAGAERTVQIRKGQYESIGLEFETYLMDQQHSCTNRCIFCFIDQLPKGLRKSLYFKDDDSRLSFLFGNYVTLTNLKEREVDRIIKMHISPINISVHTTNPELRVKMMGNRFAGKSLDILYRFAKAGIKLNCQIVLCRDINDGEELDRTLKDLTSLWPSVQSVAVVPLGLTKYRQGLYPLTGYDSETARAVVRQLERWGDRCEQKYGQRICYAADEFYLKAQLPIPPAPFYGDFDQLENGVGLMASLKQEFLDVLEDFVPPVSARKVTLATGVAAHPFLDTLLDELRQRCHNLTCNVVPIVNDFFGDTITVAGLVTGGDLLKQLRGRELGDALLLPDVMLRREGDIFLDDVSLEELSEALQIQIITVPNDGYALLDAVVGREEHG